MVPVAVIGLAWQFDRHVTLSLEGQRVWASSQDQSQTYENLTANVTSVSLGWTYIF